MFTIIFLFALVSLASAGVIDLDIFGFSYHFDEENAYRDAPLKLSPGGVWVYNPGVGIGYDFRKDIGKGGFSPILRVGFFQDCACSSLFYWGGGVRYRKFISQSVFFDVNASAAIVYAEDWAADEYNLSVFPFINFGLGYKFDTRSISYNIGYVPENDVISATDGSNLFFMNLTVSFSTRGSSPGPPSIYD